MPPEIALSARLVGRQGVVSIMMPVSKASRTKPVSKAVGSGPKVVPITFRSPQVLTCLDRVGEGKISVCIDARKIGSCDRDESVVAQRKPIIYLRHDGRSGHFTVKTTVEPTPSTVPLLCETAYPVTELVVVVIKPLSATLASSGSLVRRLCRRRLERSRSSPPASPSGSALLLAARSNVAVCRRAGQILAIQAISLSVLLRPWQRGMMRWGFEEGTRGFARRQIVSDRAGNGRERSVVPVAPGQKPKTPAGLHRRWAFLVTTRGRKWPRTSAVWRQKF